MKIHIFEILDKVKPNTENVRGLNLVAVKHMAIKVKKMSLKPELLLIGHNRLTTLD
jgi:hypothetical protein